jgi:hypothetical protein
MTAHTEPFRKRVLVPEELLPELPAGNLFWRMVTACVVAQVTRSSPAEVAHRLWPSDQLVQRAASAPAMTGTAGWAADLGQKIIIDALDGMGPSAAGARLLLLSLLLTFDRKEYISAPSFVAGAGNAGFVAEGAPVPVRQLAATAALLQPCHLGAIGVLTREMIESSNAEALVGDVLMRSASLALDAALFGSGAATAAAPAGLLNGVAALTASSATDFYEAFYQDMQALINAVSAVGGNGPFVLVASPGRAAQMMMRFVLQPGNIAVLASSAVGNAVLCIAPRAVVCAMSPDPEIRAANAGELHMESAPTDVPAPPTRSLFQTETIAIKLRWELAWAVRDTRAVAWLTPTW